MLLPFLELQDERAVVQVEELLDQRECFARLQRFVFARDLVFGVSLKPFFLVDKVALVEVEQRPGGDGDDKLVVGRVGHTGSIRRC